MVFALTQKQRETEETGLAGLLGRREPRERFELKVKHGRECLKQKALNTPGALLLNIHQALDTPCGLDTILPILQMGKQRLRKSLSNVPRLARGITWIAI